MFFKYVTIPVVFLWMLCSIPAKATHIYGGDLQYTHIGGDVYQIMLTLYGDCSAVNSAYLPRRSPKISIYKGNQLYQSLRLPEDSSFRKEVSPVCPEDEGNTSCKSATGTLPGAMRYVYTKTVSLPASGNWRIVFDGQIDTVSGAGTQAGRSSSITNITNVGTQLMYLEAFLNNIDNHNSSPQYSAVSIPFFCINRAQQYNQGAVDPDKDSLVFSLIPALLGTGGTAQYVPPYSGAVPLAAQAGSFSFNANSGQLSFLPDILQRSLVVNRVEEYKNGVLVGSSMREMTFIVLDNCENNPPTGKVDTTSIVGGGVQDNIINVCANTPNLAFTIPATDLDTDNITVTLNNIPQGATATISANGTAAPSISFSWNTQSVPLGLYNMYVTYADDACPLFSSQTIAYSIRVVNPIGISHEVIQPTNCIFRQHVQVNITDGVLPRIVKIVHSNGTVVGTYTDTTGIITDSFKRGTYTVYAESIALNCKSQYQFKVEDFGTYPIPPLHDDINICLYDEMQPIEVVPVKDATVNWYTQAREALPGIPQYKTDAAGVFQWLVSQQVDTCESVIDTVTVTVHDFPEIEIVNKPKRVCVGDGMYLEATGGVRYEWLPEDKLVYYNDSPYTYVRQPTTYIVKGYSQYNCSNTDTVTFDDIEQCCTFSYPDAFTPNNDGRNDGWHPVTYGNVDSYILSIYNRWGQRVYISSDPRLYWDGTFNGKPCGMDTYQYFLRAECATGHNEVTKGSFILIR